MKRSALILFLSFSALVGCSEKPAPPPAAPTAAPAPAPPPDKKTAAKNLYEGNGCAGCHGPDGRGKITGAPNFTTTAWQSAQKDEVIAKSIKNGKGDRMPAFKAGQGTDEEIELLIYYIRFLGTAALESGSGKAADGTPDSTARPKNKADTVFPKMPREQQ